MNISTGTPTSPPNDGTATVINPLVGHDQYFETYWVGGSNFLPAMRSKSVQGGRPNDFRSTSIITKNYMEGLPYEKKLSF